MSTQEKLEKKEDIIVSSRTFGVEIETGSEHPDSVNELSNHMRGIASVRGDSSITLPYGMEVITPVLKGKQGSALVIRICDILNKLKMVTDHVSCGMHVHLDGADFMDNEEIVCLDGDIGGFLSRRKDDIRTLLFISNKSAEMAGNRKLDTPNPFIALAQYLQRLPQDDMGDTIDTYGNPLTVKKDKISFHEVDYPVNIVGTIDKYDRQIARLYLDKENEMDRIILSEESKKLNKEGKPIKEAQLASNERLQENIIKYKARLNELFEVGDGRYVAKLNDQKPLNRIKTLMYFYVAFNEVIQGMVAPSRRIGNSYCMPIREFFTLEQIDGLTKYSEFEALWYKNGDPKKIQRFKKDHYNDSRYLDINLHSLFNRTGTIEIRLHGSTKDPNQILLWTALHQRIVDRISEQSITVEGIKAGLEGKGTLMEKCEAMIELADLPDHLAKYTRRLLAHFSDLTLD